MSEKFQNKYRIASNRRHFWDYSAPGSYFITICIEDRKEILGNVKDGKMYLSQYGEIVKNEFLQMDSYNDRCILDEWVIMPNHVHFIITLKNWDQDGADDGHVRDITVVEKIHEFSLRSSPPNPSSPQIPSSAPNPSSPPNPLSPPNLSSIPSQPTENEIKQYRRIRRKMIIPLILGKFQMLTSKRINLMCNSVGHKTWQPNYHDHVIRNTIEYCRIKQYIINNPLKYHQ